MELQDAIKIRDLMTSEKANILIALEMLKGYETISQNLFYQLVVKDITTINHLINEIGKDVKEEKLMPKHIENFTDFLQGIAFLKYAAGSFYRVDKKCRKELEKHGFTYIIHDSFYTRSKEISVKRIEAQYYLCFGITSDNFKGRCMGFVVG